MWDILNEEAVDKFAVITQVKDNGKQKELRSEDDEEDFLDEGCSKSSPDDFNLSSI